MHRKIGHKKHKRAQKSRAQRDSNHESEIAEAFGQSGPDSMNQIPATSRHTDTIWRWVETALFAMACIFVVPTYQSVTDHQFHFQGGSFVNCGVLFTGHIAIKIWRRNETVFFGATKLSVFLVLHALLQIRVM
jgi:hypothetical protein